MVRAFLITLLSLLLLTTSSPGQVWFENGTVDEWTGAASSLVPTSSLSSVSSKVAASVLPSILQVVNSSRPYDFSIVSDSVVSSKFFISRRVESYNSRSVRFIWSPSVSALYMVGTGNSSAFQITGFFWVYFNPVGYLDTQSEQLSTFTGSHFLLDTYGNIRQNDVVFFNVNTTSEDWNIPLQYFENSGVAGVDCFPVAKRRDALDLSLFNETPAPGDTLQTSLCPIVLNRFYDSIYDFVNSQRLTRLNDPILNTNSTRTSTAAYNQALYAFQSNSLISTLQIEVKSDSFTTFSSYDLDQGGSYDYQEWTLFTDRFDPSDDISCASLTTNDPPATDEEEELPASSLVEVGPETADNYRRLLGVEIGSASSISSPSLDSVELPSLTRSTVLSRETAYNSVKSRIDSALSTQGQYAALRELFSPLPSANYPSFALPSTSVTLTGGGQSFTSSFGTDTKSIDFADLSNNSTGSLITIARKIADFSIILATAWAIYRMFLGVFGSPSTEPSQGEAPADSSDGEDNFEEEE